MLVILYPHAFRARTADSRPGPGPLTSTSRFFRPYSLAASPARSAATCAANNFRALRCSPSWCYCLHMFVQPGTLVQHSSIGRCILYDSISTTWWQGLCISRRGENSCLYDWRCGATKGSRHKVQWLHTRC